MVTIGMHFNCEVTRHFTALHVTILSDCLFVYLSLLASDLEQKHETNVQLLLLKRGHGFLQTVTVQ